MDYLTRFLKVIQKRVTHLGISNYNKEAVQFLTHHFRPKELRLINAPANILSSPELIVSLTPLNLNRKENTTFESGPYDFFLSIFTVWGYSK